MPQMSFMVNPGKQGVAQAPVFCPQTWFNMTGHLYSAHLFTAVQIMERFLNYESTVTGQVCVLLLKMISAQCWWTRGAGCPYKKQWETLPGTTQQEDTQDLIGALQAFFALCKEKQFMIRKTCAVVHLSKMNRGAGYCELFISGASGMCLPAAQLRVMAAFHLFSQ